MQMKIASNEVIHFVGIGGIGMSGLAQIMHNMDFMIQGSDLSQSKNIDRLRKFGIKIFIGHKRENIKKATDGFTISELHAKKAELKDKDVKIRGVVVKYSPNIMNKNWIHIQDGSAKDHTGDLTLNTLQEVKEGQQIVVSGKLTVDKDFGSGYKYDLIILDAKFETEK